MAKEITLMQFYTHPRLLLHQMDIRQLLRLQ
jgi:hypothetical protein